MTTKNGVDPIDLDTLTEFKDTTSTYTLSNKKNYMTSFPYNQFTKHYLLSISLSSRFFYYFLAFIWDSNKNLYVDQTIHGYLHPVIR